MKNKFNFALKLILCTTILLSPAISNKYTSSIDAGIIVVPDKILDLKVEQVSSTSIKLSWSAPGYKDESITNGFYDIRFASSMITETTWANATTISDAPALLTVGKLQDMLINNLVAGQRYWFAIKTINGTNTSKLSVSIANKPQSFDQIDVWQMCGDAINAKNRRLMDAIQPDFIGRSVFEYVGTSFVDRGYESTPSLDALKNRGALLGSGFSYKHYTPFETIGSDVDRNLLGNEDDITTWPIGTWNPGEMKYYDFSTDNPDKQMIYKGKRLIDLGFDAIEFDLTSMNDFHQQNIYTQLKNYAASKGRTIYISGNDDNIPGQSPADSIQKFNYADFALRQYPRNWNSVQNYIPYYKSNVIRDGVLKPSVAFVDCGPLGVVVPDDRGHWPAFYRINEAQLLASGILPGSTYLYADYIGLENYVIEMNLAKFIRENRELFHNLTYTDPWLISTSVSNVFTSVLKQTGRTLLHLVNGNYDYNNNIMTSQNDFTAQISLNSRPTAIWMTTPDELSNTRKKSLQFTYNSLLKVATITVPKLEYHDLIVIEQGATYNPVYSPMEIKFPFPVRESIPVNNKMNIYALQTEGHSSSFNWYVNDVLGGDTQFGTIDLNGNFIAPAYVPSNNQVTIKAVSKEDQSIFSTVEIEIIGAQTLTWSDSFRTEKIGDVPSNWDIVGGLGDWKITQDGLAKVLHEYNLGDSMNPGMIIGGDQNWHANYNFDCKVKITKNPMSNSNLPSQKGNSNIQMIFGYQDAQTFYSYKLGYDNNLRLYRTYNWNTTEIGSATACSFPTIGEYHDMKILLKEGTSSFYFDGNLIRTDSVTAANGAIGFRTTATEVFYKNISVFGTSDSVNLSDAMTANFAPTIYSPAITASYENETLSANTTGSEGYGVFNGLEILNQETYVYSANLLLQSPCNRAGMVFRGFNMDWKNMFCFNSNNTIGIYYSGYFDGINRTNQMIAQKGFICEYGREYQITIKSWPDKVSVWIDGHLEFDKISIGEAKPALTGVWLENSNILMNSFLIFTDSELTPYAGIQSIIRPYGAVDYAKEMKVSIDSSLDASYEDGVITNTANGATGTALFDNIPLSDSDTFVLSSDITFYTTEMNYQTPRLVFRYVNSDWLYCIGFIGDELWIMHLGYKNNVLGWEVIQSTPFIKEFDRKYSVDIKSTSKDVSVWIDGKMLFENIPIEKYPSKTGVLFTNGSGKIENIQIYKTNYFFENNLIWKTDRWNISNILPASSVSDFLDNVYLSQNVRISTKNFECLEQNPNSKIGTGTILNVFINNVATDSYSVVVYGDVNGDSEIDILDLSAQKSHMLKISLLPENHLIAGDISKTNKGFISISDLIAIKKHLLNIKRIEQT